MIPVYGYPDFKRKLTTNPKWIARGLTVLCDGIPGVRLTQVDRLSINFMVRQLEFTTGGGLPWALDSGKGRDAIACVRRFAPAIYKFYRKKYQLPEATA